MTHFPSFSNIFSSMGIYSVSVQNVILLIHTFVIAYFLYNFYGENKYVLQFSQFLLYQSTKVHCLSSCSYPTLVSTVFEFQQLAFCLQEANLSYVEAEKASKQENTQASKQTQNILTPQSTCLNNISSNSIRYFERLNRYYYGGSNPGPVKVDILSYLQSNLKTLRFCHVKWCVGLYSQMQKHVPFYHTHRSQNSTLKAGMNQNHSTNEKHS